MTLTEDPALTQLRAEQLHQLCQELQHFFPWTVSERPVGTSLTRSQENLLNTPLSMAIKHGMVGLMQLIMKQGGLGANHLLNDQGSTILMAVVAEGHSQAVKYLLDANADPQAVTSGDFVLQTSPITQVAIEAGARPLQFCCAWWEG